jgi:hypothetical protein
MRSKILTGTMVLLESVTGKYCLQESHFTSKQRDQRHTVRITRLALCYLGGRNSVVGIVTRHEVGRSGV